MIRRRVSSAVLLLAAAPLLACCGGSDGVSAGDLEDATFVSTSVSGRDLVPGSTIRVAFEGDSMAVAAGCNTMTGAWELVDGTLAWTGDPAQTMMACEPALSDQDTWLLGLFTDGLAASESEDGGLVLEAGDVRIELDEE